VRVSKELRRTIAGKEHVCVVLKVTGRDRLGRPATAVFGYDDTTFHLEGGEEFITAWVVADVARKVAS
jgi:endonuclease YncB( thermonuclease family)